MAGTRSGTDLVVVHGREHLEGLVEMKTRTTRRDCGLTRVRRVVFRIGILWRDADIDSHAMFEVLEPCDECVSMAILENDAPTLIQAVEVLDCRNYGVGGIVRVDIHTHWQTGLVGWSMGKQQLETDVLLRLRLCGRQRIVRRARFCARIYIHDARILSLGHHVVHRRRLHRVVVSARYELLDVREALCASNPGFGKEVGNLHIQSSQCIALCINL
jgi:hypothetical protein